MVVEVHQHPRSESSSAWIIALLVVIVLAVVLWFVVGKGGTKRTDVNIDVNVPGQTTGGGNSGNGNGGR
jgi:hypothetical protein